MNERQRDLFLYLWSERRKRGRGAIALRGAIVGALGGVAFALILAPPSNAPAYDFGGQLFGGLTQILKVMLLSVPAFGFIGFMSAGRVFAAQERQYQALIQAGARVPDQKPVMQPADRWPAIMVGVAAAVIVGFIVVLFVMASTGAL